MVIQFSVAFFGYLSPRYWAFPMWVTRPRGWDLRLVMFRLVYRQDIE